MHPRSAARAHRREKGTLVTKVYPLGTTNEQELGDFEDILHWILGDAINDCVKYYEAGQCLIIRQPVEVHEQLRVLFNELHKAKQCCTRRRERHRNESGNAMRPRQRFW